MLDIEKTYKKVILVLICLILSLFSVISMRISFGLTDSGSSVVQQFYDFVLSIGGWGLSYGILTVGLFCLYFFVLSRFKTEVGLAVFSLFLAFLVLLGHCYTGAVGLYLIYANPVQFFKTIIVLLGNGAVFYCCLVGIQQLLSGRKDAKKTVKEPWDLDKKSCLRIGLIMFACYIPYLILLYPGNVWYDSVTMLSQAFGYFRYNNANPFFLTLVYGAFAKAGHALGSANIGIFVLILLQTVVFILIFVYACHLLAKAGAGRGTIRTITAVFALVPVFPFHIVTMGKNVSFTIPAMVITLFLFETARETDSVFGSLPKTLIFAVCLVLLAFTRNEGVATVVVLFPATLLIAKKHWKKLCCVFGAAMVVILVWLKGVIPLAGVAPGDNGSAFTLIPCTQTARTVYYHGDIMTEDEIEAINGIIEFDELAANYNPETSDDIMTFYNRKATKEDYSRYWKVYFKQMKQYPVIYIDAVLNKCYGYFCPDCIGEEKGWIFFGFGKKTDIFLEDGINLQSAFPQVTAGLKPVFRFMLRNVPFFSLMSSIGFYSWCALVSLFFVIKEKQFRLIPMFVPAVMAFLVCLASPVNAYFRYGITIVFCVPVFWAITALSAAKNDE